jgi:Winged helix-turn helix
MPNPFAPAVVLDLVMQKRLEALTRAHSTPQALVFRCQLILRLADFDQPSNLQVSNEFDCSRNTVVLWRTRYLQHGLAGLQDAPRSGRPRSFSPRRTAGSRHAGQQQNQRA